MAACAVWQQAQLCDALSRCETYKKKRNEACVPVGFRSAWFEVVQNIKTKSNYSFLLQKMSDYFHTVPCNFQDKELPTVVPEASSALCFKDFEREDAARYRLLQRLAPAIRHDLLGALQVPELIIGMIERRVQSASPDLDKIREDLALLRNASEKAVSSSMSFMSWIEPDGEQTSDVDTAVFDCIAMLSLPLKLKGFDLVNDVAGIEAQLSVTAVRQVLIAALIALSDHSEAPAALLVEAQAMPGFIEISIFLRPADKAPAFFGAKADRPLEWRQVEVLARAHSVQLTLTPIGAHLNFSRAA